jgi:coenzyme Q-binding protein COQ10
MTAHRESCFIAAGCPDVFDLVADVERYPEFLSLWHDARIYAREEDVYYTEQEVGLGPVRERFRTRTQLLRPERIVVTSDDRRFHAFGIRWTFEPLRGGCRAGIELSWEMRSRSLQKAIELLLPTAARSMADAFQRRAHDRLRCAPPDPPVREAR